jgi:hypothetical protein
MCLVGHRQRSHLTQSSERLTGCDGKLQLIESADHRCFGKG